MRAALGVGLCILLAGCSDDNGVTPDTGPNPDVGLDASADAKPDLSGDAMAGCGPVTTQSGAVQGVGSASGKSCSFKGIPFAKPPVGPLRFKAPEKPDAWTTALMADTFGDACPQSAKEWLGDKKDFNEDCLYLNVWTPEVKPAKPAPVLVWVHKGDWGMTGSAITAWTEGTNLAEMENIVVVSFHHRLGALGFLAHPALGADSGNYGFLDQVHALEWIKDNIAAFGGDPANVTIMGGGTQGGVFVGVHLASPKSKGLFHRAIMHSGNLGENIHQASPLFSKGPYLSRADAEAQGKLLAADSKVQCDTAADVAACLRQATPTELNTTLPIFSYDPVVGAEAFWGPIVETGGVLEDLPMALVKAGKGNKVPVLLGSNQLEGGAAAYWGGFESLPAADASARIKLLFGDTKGASVEAKYPPTTEPAIDKCQSACAAVVNLGTDYWFVCPARRTARALAGAGSDVYLYHLTYPVWKSLKGPEHSGGGHGSVKVYVFYTPLATPPPPAGYWPAWTFAPDEDKMAKEIMGYWARFARTGDPNGGSAKVWPKYDAAKDEHLELGASTKTGSKLRESYCDFWDGL